jgi:hypothetical protein
MADGKQYVTIASATDVFTFALFDQASAGASYSLRKKP